MLRHLRRRLPHPALDQLLAQRSRRRPTIESHGAYVYGVFLVPVVDGESDRVFYQEVDVVMTPALIVSVRKTPPGDQRSIHVSAARVYEQHGAAEHRA